MSTGNRRIVTVQGSPDGVWRRSVKETLSDAIVRAILRSYRGVMSPHHPWSDRFSDCFLEISLEQAFRRIVTEYRRSRCMSMRRFSLVAAGDTSARLDTVDQALESMGEPVFRPILLGELEAYLAITGIQAYLLGERSVGNPSFVCRFRNGRSPLLRTLDRSRRWMHVNSTAAERLEIRTAALKHAAATPESDGSTMKGLRCLAVRQGRHRSRGRARS